MNELTISYVSTCMIDMATDHHHRDNELLISACMSLETDPNIARGEIVDELLTEIDGGMSFPPVTGNELFRQVAAIVETIHESDVITEYDDEDRRVWILISW